MTHSTMLYMFSGPDALQAVVFFPNAIACVLSGLEPPGDIPQLTGVARGSIPRTLHGLETASTSLLTHSFFLTKKMKRA